MNKDTELLHRYGVIIKKVVSCLIEESKDDVTGGILSEREIYRSVRNVDAIDISPNLDEIKTVLEFLSSPVIGGVKRTKDGYSATASIEEIEKWFLFFSKQ